jgi:hypothetical protein
LSPSLTSQIEHRSVEIPLLIRVLSQICGIDWSDYQATQSNPAASASLLSLSQAAPRLKSSMTSWSELVELTKSSVKRTFDIFHSLAIKFMPAIPFQSTFRSSSRERNSHDTALSYGTEIIDFLDTLLER